MTPDFAGDVWRARAIELHDSVRAVLAWMRDVKGFVPTNADLREALSLRDIAMIVDDRFCPTGDAGGLFDLHDIADHLVASLRRYLAETGGYDPALSFGQQRSQEPAQQHGYMLFAIGREQTGFRT